MPITQPITERMTEAQKTNDQQGVMQAWTELRAVRKRAGMSYTAQFTPMLVQSVLGFCSFRLMRAMASLPVPGLQTGGFGWVTDLTITDGYLLLPAIMAGAMHVMFRYGGETGSNELMNPGMRSFMLWGMPGVIFLVTGWQPAAICVWFAIRCVGHGPSHGDAEARGAQVLRHRTHVQGQTHRAPQQRPHGNCTCLSSEQGRRRQHHRHQQTGFQDWLLGHHLPGS